MQYIKRQVTTKRTVKDAKGEPVTQEIKFEVEVPQGESVAEVTQMCGGEEEHLKFDNGGIATGGVNGARAFARNAPESMPIEEVISRSQGISRGYRPSGSDRGPSKKEQLSDFQTLMARLNSDTPPSEEELAELATKYATA